jgi:hypothetical protein
LLLYKEKDIEEELIDFDDFDKPKRVGAYITKMFVCNENVSPSYIEENSNDSNFNEEDNSESPISLKNCSNNIQEQNLDAKLEQSSTKMDVVVLVKKKIVHNSYPFRRRVLAVRDFPPLCGSNAPSLNKEEGVVQKKCSGLEKENFIANDVNGRSFKRKISNLYDAKKA